MSRNGRSASSSAVAADGLGVTLSAPLAFDHLGARDSGGSLRFTPHLANLTRNVLIHSENPIGTRGHTMCMGTAMARTSAVPVLGSRAHHPRRSRQHTTFDSSGNVATHIGTNQIGRYAAHMHHLAGTVPG